MTWIVLDEVVALLAACAAWFGAASRWCSDACRIALAVSGHGGAA
jgi:hypothetical protein